MSILGLIKGDTKSLDYSSYIGKEPLLFDESSQCCCCRVMGCTSSIEVWGGGGGGGCQNHSLWGVQCLSGRAEETINPRKCHDFAWSSDDGDISLVFEGPKISTTYGFIPFKA